MYYDEIPEVVVMNAEQQRFIDVNARITGIYAQMNAANNVDAEESGRREIERLTGQTFPEFVPPKRRLGRGGIRRKRF